MAKRKKIGGKLPSYEELLQAAERVAAAGEPGEPIAIAGGLAMQIWGSPRLTADLDVVAADELGYEGAPLSFGGVRTVEGGIPLDVIVRCDEYQNLYLDALEDAEEVDGVPLLVITPEYLVAMKMIAGRPKDEGDVSYLVLMDEFNRELVEEIVREHLGLYAVGELRSIIDEAKWRKSINKE